MPLTNVKILEGYSTTDYIPLIKVNSEPFQKIYNSVQVPENILNYFEDLEDRLTLVVFHAEWCGDAISTTPTILRLADQTKNLNVRIFNRDEEVDLANEFLPPHRANTVPVIVVLDEEMNEIARFIETAKGLVPHIDAMDDAIAKQAEGEAGQDLNNIRSKRTAYRVLKAQEWGLIIIEEFQQVICKGLNLSQSDRPSVGGTEWPITEPNVH
jgi:thiol-disulfide isomerase/thioredoxin